MASGQDAITAAVAAITEAIAPIRRKLKRKRKSKKKINIRVGLRQGAVREKLPSSVGTSRFKEKPVPPSDSLGARG